MANRQNVLKIRGQEHEQFQETRFQRRTMMVKRKQTQMFQKHLMVNRIEATGNQDAAQSFSRNQTFGLDCLNIETGVAG